MVGGVLGHTPIMHKMRSGEDAVAKATSAAIIIQSLCRILPRKNKGFRQAPPRVPPGTSEKGSPAEDGGNQGCERDAPPTGPREREKNQGTKENRTRKELEDIMASVARKDLTPYEREKRHRAGRGGSRRSLLGLISSGQLLKRNNGARSIQRGFRAFLARDMVKRYRRRQKKILEAWERFAPQYGLRKQDYEKRRIAAELLAEQAAQEDSSKGRGSAQTQRFCRTRLAKTEPRNTG